MRHGIDYSGGRPGGAAIVAAGYDFVMRYLWPTMFKGIDDAEVADLRAYGLALGFVFESNETRALTGGYQGGADDGLYAVARAAELGVPDTTALYFAVDTFVPQGNFAKVGDYFRGVNTVVQPGRVGGYVGKQLGAYLRTQGLITRVWQPGALYWSGGQIDETANIRQLASGGAVNGVGIDPNIEGEASDMGLWEGHLSDIDDILLSLFSGSEEQALDRATRLTNARYRMGLITNPPDNPDGPTQSFTERTKASATGLPPHTHKLGDGDTGGVNR